MTQYKLSNRPTTSPAPIPRNNAGPLAGRHRALAVKLRLKLLGVVLALAELATAQPAEPETPIASSAPAEEPAPQGNTSQSADPAGGVVAPKLIRFVEAEFPAEAAAAGVTAEILLILRVEADGSVSEVTPSAGEPPEGAASAGKQFLPRFTQAAVEAAGQFRFEPAFVNGKPMAAKIPFRYSFELSAPTQPEPVALGGLSGRVLFAGPESPIVGAQVSVTAGSEVVASTMTDVEGAWKIESLPPGSYEVQVAASGFAEVTLTEMVEEQFNTVLTYRLSPPVAGALEVSVQGLRPPREAVRRSISRREMAKVPGTSGDALRALQSLPGVARPPGLAGLLIVRGSAPQDTSVFVDGDEVPLIYHFGGLSSTLPTEMLEQIDFYPGNFSARYGRVMGGIVDVKLRNPNTRCEDSEQSEELMGLCHHGMAQVDLLDGRFALQGPLLGKDWSYAVGARRSWVDTWLKPVLRNAGAAVTSAPVYSDYQLIVNRAPSADEQLSVRFFGSSDALSLLVENPGAQDPGIAGGNLAFRTRFWRTQVKLHTALAPNVSLDSLLSFGRDQIDFTLGRFNFSIDSRPFQARNGFLVRMAQWATLAVGLDFQLIAGERSIRLPDPPRPGEPSPGPFSTRPLRQSDGSFTFFRPAWYLETVLSPTPQLTLTGGARLDYSQDTGHTDLGPRLSVRYQLDRQSTAQPSNSTTLKAAVGVFNQPAQPQETDEVFGTPGLLSNRAVHYSVGVEQPIGQSVDLNVDGFYKTMDHLVSRRPSPSGGFAYGNEGSGTVIGVESLLKYNDGGPFFGWLAYTLSRSLRRDTPEQPLRPFQFDQTHILTVLGSYALGNGWEVGARFRLVSGPLDTPVAGAPNLQALYAADSAAYTPVEGAPFSTRLPLFHQLDLRAERTWQFAAYRLSAFIDVLNSYNNAARESLLYNFDFSRRAYQQGLPLIPSVGLRGEY